MANLSRALVLGVLVAAVGIPVEADAGGKRPVAAKAKSIKKVGKASWYGPRFRGKRTASGERFNPKKFTAAHRRLPLGTRVKVTNLENGKTVKVQINDRGPYHGGRIIDLSRAAAQQLSMDGVARVRLEVLN
ncbi:MAG: septal ring lytic transglycosylase RlpA family protein [Gammaproteobacteria bacterium]|nr:septal ring lytic transglycosylase RlpA family protein [Gammaproteobacteria bacterium]